MDFDQFASLVRLDNPYQTHYASDPQKQIREKDSFNSEQFVLSLLYLVSGGNFEGAEHALLEVFDAELPHRSSFTKARSKVKWQYFRDQLYKLIESVEGLRTTFGGLRVFAIDGHHLTLPYTKDLWNEGYNGRFLEDGRETHTLRAYFSHCYDVLSGVTHGATWSATLNEHRDRRILLERVGENSLLLYDRLYFSEDLVRQHQEKSKCYFIARCKSNSSAEVAAFFADKSATYASTTRYGRRVYFLKVFHPDTGEVNVFATDLAEGWHKAELIMRLYRMRWEIESAQKDLVATCKLEQWHSVTLNGILQEFYALLWLVNITRISLLLSGATSPDPLSDEYVKPNFKLAFNYITGQLKKWFAAPRTLLIKLSKIVRRTSEKRTRYQRSYPRQIKSPASKHFHNNTVISAARPPPRR